MAARLTFGGAGFYASRSSSDGAVEPSAAACGGGASGTSFSLEEDDALLSVECLKQAEVSTLHDLIPFLIDDLTDARISDADLGCLLVAISQSIKDLNTKGSLSAEKNTFYAALLEALKKRDSFQKIPFSSFNRALVILSEEPLTSFRDQLITFPSYQEEKVYEKIKSSIQADIDEAIKLLDSAIEISDDHLGDLLEKAVTEIYNFHSGDTEKKAARAYENIAKYVSLIAAFSRRDHRYPIPSGDLWPCIGILEKTSECVPFLSQLQGFKNFKTIALLQSISDFIRSEPLKALPHLNERVLNELSQKDLSYLFHLVVTSCQKNATSKEGIDLYQCLFGCFLKAPIQPKALSEAIYSLINEDRFLGIVAILMDHESFSHISTYQLERFFIEAFLSDNFKVFLKVQNHPHILRISIGYLHEAILHVTVPLNFEKINRLVDSPIFSKISKITFQKCIDELLKAILEALSTHSLSPNGLYPVLQKIIQLNEADKGEKCPPRSLSIVTINQIYSLAQSILPKEESEIASKHCLIEMLNKTYPEEWFSQKSKAAVPIKV